MSGTDPREAFQRVQFPDHFQNTSLEEENPTNSDPTVTDHDYARRQARRQAMPEEMHMEELSRLLTEVTDHYNDVVNEDINESAEKAWSLLRAHYSTKESILNIFKHAMSGFAKSNPKQHKAFQKHIINAHIVAASDVRAHDIISWFNDIPHEVAVALKDLQRYYHKQSRLRYDLKHAEKRCGTGDVRGHLRDEEDYAVMHDYRRKNGDFVCFGYEAESEEPTGERPLGSMVPNGPFEYQPRFEGRLAVKHLQASYDVRVILENSHTSDPRNTNLNLGERTMPIMGGLHRWFRAAVATVTDSNIPGQKSLTKAERQTLDVLLEQLKDAEQRNARHDPEERRRRRMGTVFRVAPKNVGTT